jgi:alpha-beta hydrolase superfamily lysophospholipase
MASHDREEKSFQAKDGTTIYYDHFAIRSPRKEGETNSLLLIHGWCAHPFPSFSLPSSSFDERGDSAD